MKYYLLWNGSRPLQWQTQKLALTNRSDQEFADLVVGMVFVDFNYFHLPLTVPCKHNMNSAYDHPHIICNRSWHWVIFSAPSKILHVICLPLSVFGSSPNTISLASGGIPALKQSSATWPYFHQADLQSIDSNLQLQAPLVHMFEC